VAATVNGLFLRAIGERVTVLLQMIFSENRFTFFRIMRQNSAPQAVVCAAIWRNLWQAHI
jgi:hypothetical protein